MEDLCRRFLASLDTDDDAKRARLEQEVASAFNLILEVVASVHLLEPYNAEEVRASVSCLFCTGYTSGAFFARNARCRSTVANFTLPRTRHKLLLRLRHARTPGHPALPSVAVLGRLNDIAAQSQLPKDAPDVVLHALSEYCSRDLGASRMYVDLAQALAEWQQT